MRRNFPIIVDRAVAYVGGNATLFVYDESSQQSFAAPPM
jgi:hypothetical protein